MFDQHYEEDVDDAEVGKQNIYLYLVQTLTDQLSAKVTS